MPDSSGIKDKVVAITGASSGIGEATALLLSERGMKVVLGARGLDRLESLVARIEDAGGEAAYVRTDVKRREDLSELVKLACDRYGKLDVLVSNAGIAPISLLDDLCVEDWEDMIDVNIKGVLYGIAAALPVFRKQGFGHFVNTASSAGLITTPTMSVYSGTKFAVRAISEGLRQEAGDKLRVTIISPGFVQTKLADSMKNPKVKAQIVDTMAESYPLKPEKEFWSASPAGDLRKKESHLIQKSMEQSGCIYSNHCIETYEEIKERFHYVTYQTGDPDVVRV